MSQRRYDNRAPEVHGEVLAVTLCHVYDQLSSVDQQYTNCDPYKLSLGKRDIAGIRLCYLQCSEAALFTVISVSGT